MHVYATSKYNLLLSGSLFAERARYLKETLEGFREVISIFDELRAEGKLEEAKNVALRMLATGTYALEQIVTISGLSSDQVKQLQAQAQFQTKPIA